MCAYIRGLIFGIAGIVMTAATAGVVAPDVVANLDVAPTVDAAPSADVGPAVDVALRR